MPPAKAQRRQVRKKCHFDPFGQAQGRLREKSFLDPSHSLAMTGMGSSTLRLGGFAGDNSAFGCGCSPTGEPLFPSEVWEKACVTIGRYWYLFKRLTAVSAGRFYRFKHLMAYSSFKALSKQQAASTPACFFFDIGRCMFCLRSGTKEAQPRKSEAERWMLLSSGLSCSHVRSRARCSECGCAPPYQSIGSTLSRETR